MNPAVETGPERLPQLGLQDLAGAALGQGVTEVDLPWHLVGRQPFAAVRAQLLRRGGGIRLEDDDGDRDLAALAVGRGDDGVPEDARGAAGP